MAFRQIQPYSYCPDSPDQLFLELPRRKIPGLIVHQGETLKQYAEQAVNQPDVALQLPTGSGKTLVGLLVAEWRRRKFQERVVYLCPTKQLVNQVADQAEQQYGLTVRRFYGKAVDFAPSSRTEYTRGERVAVTTYSHLFNVSPFFSNPNTIILDDVHVAENYIASMWSLRLTRDRHQIAHQAVAAILERIMPRIEFIKLFAEGTFYDPNWVDKIPTPDILPYLNELTELLDSFTADNDLRYPWQTLREHLAACNIYTTCGEILIRPLIPPTWTHTPFAEAKHRVYMSATLGGGGDLERLTGRARIYRMSVPEGWDRQGIGRRYFIFPGVSLDDEQATQLKQELMRESGRSLVLVQSKREAAVIEKNIAGSIGFPTFDAAAIEESKSPFLSEQKAVAIVANRYDGIDFPGDDCRLLFVDGLPRAMNAQERFLMTRMSANNLFNERVQTRVIQAIGRCTRSLQDYSGVVISGTELTDYLLEQERSEHLHPELQAELHFGIEQSKQRTIPDFVEQFRIFLANSEQWEQVNQMVIELRRSKIQKPFPALKELHDVVSDEISYQKSMWQGDFASALVACRQVYAGLTDSSLRGYRALWSYLAGSAAWLCVQQQGMQDMAAAAGQQFTIAKNNADGLPWLVRLANYSDSDPAPEQSTKRYLLDVQLENVERILAGLGSASDFKFNKLEKAIREGLLSKEKGPFEDAHVKLGNLLGFAAGNDESDAAPDPWWVIGDYCIIFEDHQGAESTSKLQASKARQAASHPSWVLANIGKVPVGSNVLCIPVLVTPVSKAEIGARPHLTQLRLWPLSEFREFASTALNVIRRVRSSFTSPGSLTWRKSAAHDFAQNGLDPMSLIGHLNQRLATELQCD